MLNDLEPTARELADYMSELSEQAYYAGWMHDLEHALWHVIVTGPRRYGHLDLTIEHVNVLKRLGTVSGGWVYFDEVTEETFVPLEKWREMYDPLRAQRR